MVDSLLATIAPHLCFGCGFEGTALCDSCKYDIGLEQYERCIVCGQLSAQGVCARHRLAYSRAWCVGERRDALERLIDAYKFERVRAAASELAELLHRRLPEFPTNTIVVPVPTVSGHIRQRGYDHALLLARRFARLRGLSTAPLLRRVGNATQHGSSKAERLTQAQRAFQVSSGVDPTATYLVIDDIITTGATLDWATKRLAEAGARQIFVAALAKQPLD